MKRSLQSNLLAIVLTFAAVALLVAVAYANGAMSPRLLGVVLVLLIGVLSIAITLNLKRAGVGSGPNQSRTATEPSKTGGLLRRLQTAVVALPILLVIGLWVTRGGPLFPRITGSGSQHILYALVDLLNQQSEEAASLNPDAPLRRREVG